MVSPPIQALREQIGALQSQAAESFPLRVGVAGAFRRGKTTLINRLCEQVAFPGMQWLELAGYGGYGQRVEVETLRPELATCSLLLLCYQPDPPLGTLDQRVHEIAQMLEIPVWGVLTKIDCYESKEIINIVTANHSAFPHHFTVSLTGGGAELIVLAQKLTEWQAGAVHQTAHQRAIDRLRMELSEAEAQLAQTVAHLQTWVDQELPNFFDKFPVQVLALITTEGLPISEALTRVAQERIRVLPPFVKLTTTLPTPASSALPIRVDGDRSASEAKARLADRLAVDYSDRLKMWLNSNCVAQVQALNDLMSPNE
jgi:hypothetical protein